MNEVAKFETYQKKLQGICDENNLICTFSANQYPITLIIKPSGDFEGQMSLLENEGENEYTSVNATLRFFYNDGDDKPTYKFSEDFTISEALLTKLKNLFANMCRYWWRFFFRDVMEKKLLSSETLPCIEEDIEVPDDLPDDAEPIEDLDPVEDIEGIEGIDE